MKRTSLLNLVFVGILLATSSCTAPEPPSKVLLISFDGFINEYVERNPTPNFDRFIADGVQAEYLIPVFPTKTFPNHYSTVTGLHPENHGIITNSFYDDRLEARFSYGPQGTPNDERWWGGEPIWTTVEKQGLTASTFFWPGSEASINGVLPTRWMDYDGSVPNEARVDSVLAWLDPQGPVQADFATLYFSDVDSRGHSYGPNSPEVDEAVIEMDHLLGMLMDGLEEIGLLNEVHILITSDHGMAELSHDKVIFLDDIIDLDDVDVIDWTPVAMLQPKEGRTETLYAQLKEAEENYRVFMRDDLPDHYRFSNHYRIPDILMIADISWTITSRPFYEDRGLIAATHGYDHMEEKMRTFFAANGPRFRSGETAEAFQLVHLYELMAHLLGVEPAPNDGDFEAVRPLLQ